MPKTKPSASSPREKPSVGRDESTKKATLVSYVPAATRAALTPEQIARRKAVADLPDDEIDFSDIPPIRGAASEFERGRFYRPLKLQTTLRLDADIIEWFKRHSGEEGSSRGYQTRINRALREHIMAAQRAKD